MSADSPEHALTMDDGQLPEGLRDNVRLLGELLGDTILEHKGPGIYRKLETIRSLSINLSKQAAAETGQIDYKPLVKALEKLPDAEVLPVARAFNQFLNLANIADMQHFHGYESTPGDRLGEILEEMVDIEGKDAMLTLMQDLRIGLVLTAHPTEISRRTLIHKYEKVANALQDLKRDDLEAWQVEQVRENLVRVVAEIWHTDEIRPTRPTAVDEAKWGFAVIENSLWQAVPEYLRHLDKRCLEQLGNHLPMNCQPFRFYSWMGGDRDGNPNVTHGVTREVILLGRWKAAELYLMDVQGLIDDLSIHDASQELLDFLGETPRMPYRNVLHGLRHKLRQTMAWAELSLKDERTPVPDDIIHSSQEILDVLTLCQRSLEDVSHTRSARGPVIDMIRKVHAFGINLLPLDIRQHSERHAQVMEEVVSYLELGNYGEWSEQEKQDFLLKQLESKRPLIPRDWPMSDDVREVLTTCEVLAEQPRETLSHYVISMATQASDVLTVALLLRESGMTWNMPVVPLFETLDDLENAAGVMKALWAMPWYRNYIEAEQTVMIGYSDSAKDAGKFTATWAQYRCQEVLVAHAKEQDVRLHLFHGRGGTIGRGGGPVEKAMASQPPGSVQGTIRVTEQGEMIRYKFGMPTIAFNSLGNYLQSVLRATVAPAPPPKPEWRTLMDTMSDAGLKAYRHVVQEHPDFVPYFRSLTPEQELSKLALGSRPAKRKADGGVESLRAIPWVFAWTQVRLNLPGWLGIGQALEVAQQESPDTLREMLDDWPFFTSFLDLVEMVLGKCDSVICAHYEACLVEPSLHPLGKQLRGELSSLIDMVNTLKGQNELLDGSPMLQQSIDVRKPYVDPLNYLQAELLRRERKAGKIPPELERALMVTMGGIAAGMRNTG